MRSLRVAVRPAEAEHVADLLWVAGVSGIEERVDDAHGPVLIASFEDEREGAVRAALGSAGCADAASVPIDEADSGQWLDAWRPWARPARLDDSLWVSPTWVTPETEPSSVILWVEPGRAWGHGSHPTTVMSAQRLLGLCGPSASVLDVGCGSGVLSLVAVYLGSEVTACDVDPEARRVTEANARANGLSGAIEVTGAQLGELASGVERRTRQPWSVLVANLGLAEFKTCAEQLRSCCSEGGALVLSGILDAQLDATVALMEPLDLVGVSRSDGWVAAEFGA